MQSTVIVVPCWNEGNRLPVARCEAFLAAEPDVGLWDADLAAPPGEILDFRRLLESRPELEIVLGARERLLGRRDPAQRVASPPGPPLDLLDRSGAGPARLRQAVWCEAVPQGAASGRALFGSPSSRRGSSTWRSSRAGRAGRRGRGTGSALRVPARGVGGRRRLEVAARRLPARGPGSDQDPPPVSGASSAGRRATTMIESPKGSDTTGARIPSRPTTRASRSLSGRGRLG